MLNRASRKLGDGGGGLDRGNVILGELLPERGGAIEGRASAFLDPRRHALAPRELSGTNRDWSR